MRGFRLRYDGKDHRQKTLVFTLGRTLGGSQRRDYPFGAEIKTTVWKKVLADASGLITAAGEAIDLVVSPNGVASRLELASATAQALTWFHDACREEDDAFAVVSFSACLDALAGGKGVQGILDLLSTQLGVKPTDPIRAGGPSYKNMVERLYNEGRSRTVHGTSAKVGHDWTEARGTAEQLARLALVYCLEAIGDDPKTLRLEQLRAS